MTNVIVIKSEDGSKKPNIKIWNEKKKITPTWRHKLDTKKIRPPSMTQNKDKKIKPTSRHKTNTKKNPWPSRLYDCHPCIDCIGREEQSSRQRDKTCRDREVFGETKDTNGSLPKPVEARRNCHASQAPLAGAIGGCITDALSKFEFTFVHTWASSRTLRGCLHHGPWSRLLLL